MLGAGRKSNKFNLASEPGVHDTQPPPPPAARRSPACSAGGILLYYIRRPRGSSRQVSMTLFMHWRAISVQRSIICSHSLGTACAQYIPRHHAKGIASLLPLLASGGYHRKPIFCTRCIEIKTHSLSWKARLIARQTCVQLMPEK